MSINANNNISPSSLLNATTSKPQAQRTPPLERDTAIKQTARIQVDRDAIAQLDNEREAERNRQAFSSGNEQRNERAIAAYQSMENEQRRNEVKAMLGVDIYA